ncbi:hypothetical protein XELAEV_18021356mg [Xenopus laevis]|uniref:Helix-turn-helix domain-containing protein n=1 Tax=Xenopus laevis TaxID=8355 RepID=A0A974D939_XENLA|nr:hypothetical protein XELAEV_18021356mg [Xenopus laevis]
MIFSYLVYSNYSEQVKNFILEAIWYLLTHNFFLFGKQHYLQRRGTAMGACFAPTYANLYMGWWEENHVFGGSDPNLERVILFRRYIDDLLFIWAGNKDSFQGFVESLTNEELNLKFTSTFNTESIVYLDLLISTKEQEIVTTIYSKLCTGNSLLRADSCHPGHLNKGIPRGQFLRLRRNCSSEDKFLEESCKLRDKFLEKNYNMQILQAEFERALNIDRKELLRSRKRGRRMERETKKEQLTLSMQYSAQFNRIKNIVNKFLPVLQVDRDYKQILDAGIRVVARRAPTIGSVLAPSLYQKETNNTTWLQSIGSYKCGGPRCVTCTVLKKSTQFTSSVTQETYQIRNYINCNTQSVIYLLTCMKCSKQYVGCTMRRLKERIREHLNLVSTGNASSPVSRHFKECNNSNTKLLMAQGIERVTLGPRGGDLQAKLLKAEVRWIFKLQTRQPQGLNSVFDINCYFK